MKPEPKLSALAGLWGVQTSYRAIDGGVVRASRGSLLAVLEALGAPVSGPGGVDTALRKRRRQLWERCVEPVVVAWEGRLSTLTVRLPATITGRVEFRLALEDGGTETFPVELGGTAATVEEVEGVAFAARSLRLGRQVPLGYHRLSVDAGGHHGETMVISAPRHAYGGEEGGASEPRQWGLFVPLYAVHSRTSFGVGDLGDLTELLDWVGDLGGGIVATLPLFATFLEQHFEPSPYSPVSRRFWNEIFIDLAAVPEVVESPEVRQARDDNARFLAHADLLTCELVDYPRVAAVKRKVLTEASRALLSGPSARRDELERFAAGHPNLEDYAAFRAAGEKFRTPWQEWPEPARGGHLAAIDVPEEARSYHRYVQWLAHSQLEAASRSSRTGLMLDLPLGVHRAGYDVWRDRDAFLTGTTAGAPPDPLNVKGQNWGNPPLHPEGIRSSGYAYPIASLRHLMAHSRVLRLDHVMGLHRLFVLPAGGEGTDGVYIRYQGDEAYAILSLESHRARTIVVGEDLGTVPSYVRRAMAAHHVHRTYVAQWGIDEHGLAPVPADSVASINTHDMAPFASWWRGVDIEERLGLGLLTEAQAEQERAQREEQRRRLVAALAEEGLLGSDQPSEGEVLEAWLAHLARSDARLVVVALEDLWGSATCQNLPGTVDEHPNWRRRLPYPLEVIRSMPQVVGRLNVLNMMRARPEIREEAPR